MSMRSNAKDYLFVQGASLIAMWEGSRKDYHYWLDKGTAQLMVDKFEWLLSECFGQPIRLDLSSDKPQRSYKILVDGVEYEIHAKMVLIDVEGPDSTTASKLFDCLTSKFYRITPNNLEDMEPWQEFISACNPAG